jgi:hypothetical protein
MTGLGITLYTDEDVDVRLAMRLNRDGYDILSARDAGNAHRSLPDEWHLLFAVEQQRALLTHNFADFALIDREWRAKNRSHCGIILVGHVPIGELVRRTTLHLDNHRPENQYNTVLYLHP